MSYGKLYGVGVGPGDKELVTLKAVRILKESDVIMAPVMRNGEKTALDIVSDYVDMSKVVDCKMPMTKDFEELNRNYTLISDRVEEYLKDGKQVAFITLGDPTVYSSYMQVNEIILSRGYETELIAGVTSFCAAAARLNTSLCERSESLTILPSSYQNVREGLEKPGNKVLMKAGKEILEVRDILKDMGKLDKAVLVERCGMKEEKIYTDLAGIDEKTSYFSVIIVKE